jgi:hypothetical protein
VTRVALIAALALTACQPTPPPPAPSNPAAQMAVAVFTGTGYTEPLGSNVTWYTVVPVWNGETYAGLTESNYSCIGGYCTNWTVKIHPDYVRPDVVAHEGGHRLTLPTRADTPPHPQGVGDVVVYGVDASGPDSITDNNRFTSGTAMYRCVDAKLT